MSTTFCANPECGVPIRRASTPAHMAPGTKPRAGGGMCSKCWRRLKGVTRSGPVVPVLPKFDHVLAAVALEGFLAERRARLARRRVTT